MRTKKLSKLQKIILAFPDDVEAKAQYAMYSIDGEIAYATELVIREVLKKEPDHPGAHHYRIHNWDGVAPEQALESCRRYARISPGIGHANHMPGHNYSKLGMWHEAAISMDTATRVELRYMNERLAFPFETWNYAHNRNFLCYIQEQLGMERASLDGAKALLAAPRDPGGTREEYYSTFDQGLQALVRCLIKFERWDEILRSDAIPWRDNARGNADRAFAETLAHIGRRDLIDARLRLADLRAAVKGQTEKESNRYVDLAIAADAVEGLLRSAEGDVLEGTRLLLQAAALEHKKRGEHSYRNDPPPYPWPVNRILGDIYLERGEMRLAAQAYGRGLEDEANDAFALAGLAMAHFALGELEAAARDAGRFSYVWSNADGGLRWKSALEELGIKADSIAKC